MRVRFEIPQDIQQGGAVLAPGQGYTNTVFVSDEIIGGYGAQHVMEEPLAIVSVISLFNSHVPIRFDGIVLQVSGECIPCLTNDL